MARVRMPKSKKARCNFRNMRSATRKTVLPKSFDLYDVQYKAPVKKDLAVGLVYFNCAKSKRLLMNYLYVAEKFKMAGIPTFTIEMYETTPEIKDAIHVKTDFILFQKERLCYVLEKHIPESFTKLLFIDCDLLFENANWYNDLSEKLDTFQIVQPFSKGVWLDITYKKVVKERIPIVFYQQFGVRRTKNGGIGGYHPGFAWAFQRNWYREHGFFTYAILGDGDTLSSTVWLDYSDFTCRPFMKASLDEYKHAIAVRPTICYIQGNMYHLWHGDQKNRQYSERRNIFSSVKDIRDILRIDTNGLFALKNDTFKPRIRKYFRMRDDDGLEIPS